MAYSFRPHVLRRSSLKLQPRFRFKLNFFPVRALFSCL